MRYVLDMSAEMAVISTTSAVREWCQQNFQRDPEFARIIDGQGVTVRPVGLPPGLAARKFVVSVRVPPPEFDVAETA